MTEVVYVIGEAGSPIVKIGMTKTPTERLVSLQTGNPRPLAILWTGEGSRALEDYLHTAFAVFRIRGEWFDFGAIDPVEAVREAVSTAPSLPTPRLEDGGTRSDARLSEPPEDPKALQHTMARQLNEHFYSILSFTLEDVAERLSLPLEVVTGTSQHLIRSGALIAQRRLSPSGQQLFTLPWRSGDMVLLEPPG